MKSNSTTKSASTSLVLLFRLIAANDWQQLKDMFLSDPEGAKTFQYLAALVAKSSSYNGMTILHACAQFNPPAVLVNRMIELCPDAPSSRDCLNRTPLHVAAGTGASSAMLKVLVDSYPDACMIQDKDGRTPLMMCCDSSCELFDDSRERTHRPAPSYRATTVLLSASLDSVILEDDDGMSAIEYALCSNADLLTVQLIQSAAQKVMRKKHKEKRANKAEGLVSKKCIAAATKGFSQSPRRLLTAPSA